MSERNDDRQIQLNALADGELVAADSEALLERIEQDADLREALCDIHRLKDMVRYAYAESTPPRQRRPLVNRFRMGLAVAALALLSIGFVGGRLTLTGDSLTPFELSQATPQPNKVVLFVGYSDKTRFKQALDRAEQLLKQYRGRGVEVNVVASSGGIDLLRKSASPYLDRIKRLSDDYDAIEFIACNNTIARLVRQGKNVELVDSAVVKPSAVQFVVERLQQGWSYVAI